MEFNAVIDKRRTSREWTDYVGCPQPSGRV